MFNLSKSMISILFLVLLTQIGCSQKYSSEIAYIINEKDLIPEGITYSKTTNSFYLSSLNKTKIVRIDAETGEHKDFISDILSMMILGLGVDDERGFLWACALDAKQIGRSTVARFDLHSGKLLNSYERQDSLNFTINDLAIAGNGNIYYTSRAYDSVFEIDIETDSVHLIIQSPDMEHPNGISISPNDKYLYVASGSKGMCLIDIAEGKLIQNNLYANSNGIDGLKFYEQSLIGIRNGVEDPREIKVIRYFLDSSLTKITGEEIIDQNNPDFDIPTTCVIANNKLYVIGNSQLGNFSGDGINDESFLSSIKILKYSL